MLTCICHGKPTSIGHTALPCSIPPQGLQANGAYPAQRQPPQQQQHTSLANGSAFATDNGLSGVEKAIAQVMQSPEAVCNPSGVSTNEVSTA